MYHNIDNSIMYGVISYVSILSDKKDLQEQVHVH